MQEAVVTAGIEGERLDLETVRSSVARRLGIAGAKAQRAPRHIDGLLDLADDAVGKAAQPLTHGRLQAWQPCPVSNRLLGRGQDPRGRLSRPC